MFTEDYLMRIISQALAALMTAIGLRKAGKYLEAQQAIHQAIEQLTSLSANLVEQMDDASLLSLLTVQCKLDIGRLAILADLFQEEGEILSRLGQSHEGYFATMRALRFTLEVFMADDGHLSAENIGKIETLNLRLKERDLPVETQLALSDYYQRLLDMDDQMLAAGGTSRKQASQALAKLQDQLGSS